MGHWRLVLRVQRCLEAVPGQFVNILCRDADPCGHDSGRQGAATGPLLRRPFSLAELRLEGSGCTIDVLHRVIGPGTAWLASRRVGDRVNIIGPLGHAFSTDRSVRRAVLVGGGIGVPPLLWLARVLAEAGVAAVLLYGARSTGSIPLTIDQQAMRGGRSTRPTPCVRELAEAGVPAIVCTDDGSLGRPGLVTDALEALLEGEGRLQEICVYTCGPEAMMRRVAEICRERNIACQACLERVMGCGLGTCQSCVVKVIDRSVHGGWRYALCCTDGPVFDAQAVIW